MRVLLFLFLSLVLAQPLAAKEAAPQKLGSFHGWQVYALKSGGQSMCYMVLHPAREDYRLPATAKPASKKTAKEKPEAKKNAAKKTSDEQCLRSEVYLMVTFRPSESMNPVVSYRSGYIFKQGSEVSMGAGGKPFNLFTDKDQAWARSSAMDIAVTGALRKGGTATVKGISTTGGRSSDVFQLDGADSAYKAIVKACGIT